jgi:uncharacterized membrane protein YoaT (DUF817 family)
MYWKEILWLLSWPLLIIFSFIVINQLVKHTAKKFQDSSETAKPDKQE